jgi:hypothetical protein
MGGVPLALGGSRAAYFFLGATWSLAVSGRLRACAVGFPPVSVETEDWLAEVVAFDGEFSGGPERCSHGPVAVTGGPDSYDGIGGVCAFCQPIAGAVAEGSSCEVYPAVAAGGGDLAFACGFQGDGEHAMAFLALCRRLRSVLVIGLSPVQGLPLFLPNFVASVNFVAWIGGVFVAPFVAPSACLRTSRAVASLACLSARWS